MSEPYTPSNGTEGMAFEEAFCDQCERDRPVWQDEDYENGCPIHAAAFCGSVKEWIEDENGPRCTSFLSEGVEPPLPGQGMLS